MKPQVRHALSALLAAVALAGPSLSAQQNTPADDGSVRAALVKDMGALSDKFVGLARVMAGKYDWRPMDGVRSVGDVFNLIVMENTRLEGLLSGSTRTVGPGMPAVAPVTDPAAMQEALRASYAKVADALSGLPEADLATPVTLFGRSTTKQGAVLIYLFDQHEHLGQSIAYARSNMVVPPWSR